jgi:glycosyltransferase involved in cell wall biosynthesis/SAM-dependent methyltransferase
VKHYVVGPYPPPLGGISVFIHRFAKQLEAEGKSVEIIDLSKCSRLAKVFVVVRLALCRQSVVHLNVLTFSLALALLINPFRPHVIFYDHATSRDFVRFSRTRRLVIARLLKRLDECVLIAEHLTTEYSSNGFALPRKTIIRTPFLPPPLDEEEAIRRTYDDDTLEFAAGHKPLLIANAFRITFYNEVDLYGLDMCVELVGQLKPSHPKIGLLFALAEVGDDEYFEKIKTRVRELGIENNIHFMTGQKELWPLFKQADLMLRPTVVDGYGISVAEARYFRRPAVASDVCTRAEGTVLFRNRDATDLLEKVRAVLEDARDDCQPASTGEPFPSHASGSPLSPEYRRGATRCKACLAGHATAVRQVRSPHSGDSFTLYRCGDCGSRFFEANEHPADFGRLYDAAAGRFYQLDRAFRVSRYWAGEVKVIRRLLGELPQSVLDVGCGTGELLLHWPAGTERRGVELAAPAAAVAKARGLDVIQSRLESVRFREEFDVVTCYAILEHLNEPRPFLETLVGLVRENGVLAIMIPSHETWKARLLDSLGVRWHMHSPPEHLMFYARSFLDNFLASRGFTLVRRRYTSGGMFNPLAGIPVLAGAWSRLNRVAEAYTGLNRLPAFDHMYSYYRRAASPAGLACRSKAA